MSTELMLMSDAVLQQHQRDYRRIAEAIRYIRSHVPKQPTLNEVALHLGLSDAHLQRLFSRWAGISPKRFLQFLTVEEAKRRLRTARDLPALSLDSGLSGPGRLHDLVINLEAMTPGEFKRGGCGLEIRFGMQPSPFGRCLIVFTERGICQLQFAEETPLPAARQAILAHWPGAKARHDATGSARLANAVFNQPTSRCSDSLTLWVKGTNFQIQVWRALLAIPPGAAATYRDVAVALGRPQAARAVGNAVAANPVAYLIPCHRVICQSGAFGNYHWGPDRKAAMLVREAAAPLDGHYPNKSRGGRRLRKVV
jgi:AraC family transcriptional regulator of adaptative response/methylated-DNA-[protein]-cysteine methyltransferase